MARYVQQVRAASGRTVFEDEHDLMDDDAACRLARETVRDRFESDQDRSEARIDLGEVSIVDADDRLVISLTLSV